MDSKLFSVVVVVITISMLAVRARDIDNNDLNYKALADVHLKKKYTAADDYVQWKRKRPMNDKDFMRVKLALGDELEDGTTGSGSDPRHELLVRKRRGWNLQYVNVKYTPSFGGGGGGSGGYSNNKIFRRNFDFYNEIPRYHGRNLYGGHF